MFKKGKSDELFTQGSILLYPLFTASFSLLYLCCVKSAVPIRVKLSGGVYFRSLTHFGDFDTLWVHSDFRGGSS